MEGPALAEGAPKVECEVSCVSVDDGNFPAAAVWHTLVSNTFEGLS